MHNEPSANSGDGPVPLNYIRTLSYQSTPIRFALIDGQPWFVAADICKAVGVYNPRHGAAKYVRAIADDQKALVKLPDIPRGSPAVLMVSQSGLDKLLWLALHSVSEAWALLSSVNAQVTALTDKRL
ncbi:BRO family protein [Ensifer sp. ENS03]|uniref:BRO-N domain-containing protein n=1 Tax=Ensifer sp. ENS03 TaxID=2769283 RepID=UPI0017875752|nr:BRO family protein [Ensifer sp. ENS03]MBD9558452.1 hypothetical protein [Ensifer sp. ENS03]